MTHPRGWAQIISHASALLEAEGCSIFLRDGDELYAKVFETPDGIADTDSAHPLVKDEIRFGIGTGPSNPPFFFLRCPWVDSAVQ